MRRKVAYILLFLASYKAARYIPSVINDAGWHFDPAWAGVVVSGGAVFFFGAALIESVAPRKSET